MRVLISRPDKIGDVVLALHGAKQLKTILPNVEVYFHVTEYTAPLVRNVRFVDGCLLLNEDLKPYRFDAAVDLMAKSKTARLYRQAGIKIRIGNSARWFRVYYNRTKCIRRSHALINEAEYNWELISLLDPALKNTPLSQSLSLEDFINVKYYSESEEYYILMPGVSVSAGVWDPKNWVNLAKLLVENTKGKVLFVTGPAEKALERELRAAEDRRFIIRSCPEIEELIGLLARSSAYVGPSTGITHLAAAAGTAGVALYPEVKSMHPQRWAPFRSDFEIVSLAKSPSPEDIGRILAGEKLPELSSFNRAEISAFVVCCNEEKNIRRCLNSVSWVDELVVVDSGSTDGTIEICKEYTDKVFHQKWKGHSGQKQFALDKCSKEWVINIDSDEEVSPRLRGEILRMLAMPEEKRNRIKGYNLCRVVYFLQRWWDRGGWYPEYRLRLFQRSCVHWGGTDPHEKAIISGRLGKMRGLLYHYTYTGIAEQIRALNKYSSNSAECLFREGKRSSFVKMVFHPPFRFLKFYLLKCGYRAGLAGFTVACIEAMYAFLKYAKLWELERMDREKP